MNPRASCILADVYMKGDEMAISTVVTLFKRDFDVLFECDDDVKSCKYAVCEEMPPTDSSKCSFERGLQCQNVHVRLRAVNALIRRLRNKKKELEEDEFLTF